MLFRLLLIFGMVSKFSAKQLVNFKQPAFGGNVLTVDGEDGEKKSISPVGVDNLVSNINLVSGVINLFDLSDCNENCLTIPQDIGTDLRDFEGVDFNDRNNNNAFNSQTPSEAPLVKQKRKNKGVLAFHRKFNIPEARDAPETETTEISYTYEPTTQTPEITQTL